MVEREGKHKISLFSPLLLKSGLFFQMRGVGSSAVLVLETPEEERNEECPCVPRTPWREFL